MALAPTPLTPSDRVLVEAQTEVDELAMQLAEALAANRALRAELARTEARLKAEAGEGERLRAVVAAVQTALEGGR